MFTQISHEVFHDRIYNATVKRNIDFNKMQDVDSAQ